MGSQVITMSFDAETQKFVSNVLKAKEALESTAKSGTDMGDKIAAAGDKAMVATAKMKQGTAESGEGVAALASKWLTLAGVVKMASDAWIAHLQLMREKADALRSSNDALVKSLAPSGQTADLPAVRQKLGAIQSSLFTAGDVRDTYTKISERGGREFSTDEKVAATRQAMRAGAAGHEDLAGFGVDFLQIQKQMKAGGISLKDNEIGSLVAQLAKSKPGGMDEMDQRLLAHDNDKFRALDLIAARARSKEGAKAVNALEQEALEEPSAELLLKAKKHKHKLTDEDKRKLDLGDIAPGDRIGAMLDDPTLAPERQRLLIANLGRNMKSGEFKGSVKDDALGTEIGDIMRLRGSDRATDESYRAREIEVRRAKLKGRGNRLGYLEDINDRESRSVTNAEMTGLEEGNTADVIMALGKVKDAMLSLVGLTEKQNDHLEEIKGNTANTSHGGPARGHTLENK